MKKIIYAKFGGPEVLQVADYPIPTIEATNVLIKIKAVSLNPLDWKIRNGDMKLMSGSNFPKGIGIDFSGVIAKTGTAVNNYKPGDEVFGILDVFKGPHFLNILLPAKMKSLLSLQISHLNRLPPWLLPVLPHYKYLILW